MLEKAKKWVKRHKHILFYTGGLVMGGIIGVAVYKANHKNDGNGITSIYVDDAVQPYERGDEGPADVFVALLNKGVEALDFADEAIKKAGENNLKIRVSDAAYSSERV